MEQGKYASKAQMTESIREARKIVEKLHARGLIRSGLVYGSTVKSGHIVGSDVDLLIISRAGKEKTVSRYLRSIYNVALKHNLIPSFDHYSEEDVETGFNNLSPDYLRGVMGHAILVGEDPRLFVKFHPSREDQAKVVAQRMLQLIFETRKKQIEIRGGRDEVRSLAGVYLGKAFNTARMMLGLYAKKPLTKPDTKQAVFRSFRSTFGPKSRAFIALHRIYLPFKDYEAALDRAISAIESGEANRIRLARADYERSPRNLETIPSSHLDFINANFEHLSEHRPS